MDEGYRHGRKTEKTYCRVVIFTHLKQNKATLDKFYKA